ncbi:MAG: DNA-3-methyladenine glycosylase 2 family protein [bacterium]|nr:DNA-3-methyladenine glycosylase 2 family protein [bacterium]
MTAPATRTLLFEGDLDFANTLGPLTIGRSDPTCAIGRDGAVRATRTPVGPATLLVQRKEETTLSLEAWGDGAEWVLEHARDLLGLNDEPPSPDDFPQPIRRLAKRRPGIRFARGHRVVELLVPAVLQQKVSNKEAKRAFRNLVARLAEPAPGPFDELRLPLGPEQLRDLTPALLPPLGILPRQGETLRRIGERASRLEEAGQMTEADAFARLTALPGLGSWTASSVMGRGLGFADQVPLGDWNLPHLVAFRLAGEERADDARMIELLEPFRGHRGRVIRWLHTTGKNRPRRGPRMALRPLPRA